MVKNNYILDAYLIVTANKKTCFAFFVAVIVCCSAQGVHSSETDSNNKHLEAPAATSNSFSLPLAGVAPKTDTGSGRTELFYKMIQAVLIVCVLGFAAIYISKKFLPKITNRPGKKIHIAEVLHIGPKKSLHLIEVDKRRLLIGSTSENITLLADLTDSFSDEDNQSSPHTDNT